MLLIGSRGQATGRRRFEWSSLGTTEVRVVKPRDDGGSSGQASGRRGSSGQAMGRRGSSGQATGRRGGE